MIGTIISKTSDQPCEHSARCYQNASGGISHLGRCPILQQQWKEREKEQREARAAHKRFMASAKTNLEELSYLPTTIDKPTERIGRIKI